MVIGIAFLQSVFLSAQITSDNFADGNFTTSPTWQGDVSNWVIKDTSTAAAGATNSKTLIMQVAAGGGVQYIQTPIQAAGTSQEWRFFLGRRAQTYTNTNRVAIWLWANEANLESSTVDGYRLVIGEDVTAGDKIYFQKVQDSVSTNIFSSAPIANAVTDIGIAIRVTRDASGIWTLYTTPIPNITGSGVTASYAIDASTVSSPANSGSNTDYPISGTGHFGIVAKHSAGATARNAVEFDNFWFNSNGGGGTGPVIGTSTLLDNFNDNNFTSAINNLWQGNITNWIIKDSSDVSGGAPGSKTLRLNTATGSGVQSIYTAYSPLTTQANEWSFFIGRRAQSYTNTNQVAVWLWTPNGSLLETNQATGYRIQIGDDNSTGDKVKLQLVETDSVFTTLLSSAPFTNNLIDIGILVRVTRTATGIWELFTSTLPASSGTGYIAADIATSTSANVSAGATSNTTFALNTGYFGIVAKHSSSASARSAVEIDNIYWTAGAVTGISNSITNSIVIYPNPATSFIHIQTDEILQEATIFNATGQQVIQVKNSEIENNTIDISNLSEGYYYLVMTNFTGQKATKRLVIVK